MIALPMSLLAETRARCSRSQTSERFDQRLRLFLAHGFALVGRLAVDLALDVEQLVDAAHGLQRDRRLGQFRQFEEFAPRSAPSMTPRRSAPVCGRRRKAR